MFVAFENAIIQGDKEELRRRCREEPYILTASIQNMNDAMSGNPDSILTLAVRYGRKMVKILFQEQPTLSRMMLVDINRGGGPDPLMLVIEKGDYKVFRFLLGQTYKAVHVHCTYLSMEGIYS